MKDRPILFYDGDCRACTLAARLALAADTRRRLRSATLDGPEADRHLRRLPRRVRHGAFHLLRGGRVLTGPDAIGPLLELLPPVAPVGRLVSRSRMAKQVAGAVYEGLSRVRGPISRLLPPMRPPDR